MIRKIRWYWVLLLFTVSFILSTGNAHARIDGCWNLKGKGKVIVKIQGSTERERIRFLDELCLSADGSFSGDFQDAGGFTGRWTQKGRKFLIKYDVTQIEDYFEELFESLIPRASITVDIKKCFYKGKIKKGNLVGKVYLKGGKGKIRYQGKTFRFRFSALGNFTGSLNAQQLNGIYGGILEMDETPEESGGAIYRIVDGLTELLTEDE